MDKQWLHSGDLHEQALVGGFFHLFQPKLGIIRPNNVEILPLFVEHDEEIFDSRPYTGVNIGLRVREELNDTSFKPNKEG